MMPNPASVTRPRAAAHPIVVSHPFLDACSPVFMTLLAAALWVLGLMEFSHLWDAYEDRILFCYAWYGVWILTASAVSCYHPAPRMAKRLIWILTLPLGYLGLIAIAGISRAPLP